MAGFLAGQRVTLTGRTGVVLLDNSANVAASANPSVFVAFVDGTFVEASPNDLTNVTGGWMAGIGPGN